MKFLISNFIIIATIIGGVYLKCSDKTTVDFKIYKINLDEPALQRFSEPSFDFRNEISALVEAQK